MAHARMVKPTEVDEYVFHIVKLYTILKTSIALGEAIFENDEEVCAQIEVNFVNRNFSQRKHQEWVNYIEGEVRDSALWEEITINAMRKQLSALLTIVGARGGRCVELNSVEQKLTQLFRDWSSKGPLSPSAVREKYFINPVSAARATRLMGDAISSESADGSTGAAKSTVAAPPVQAQATQVTTLWDWLCCCGKAKPEEPEQATAASPLVSPRGQGR